MAKDYSNISKEKALAIIQKHRGNTASIQTKLYGSSSAFNTEIDHNYRSTKKACLSSVNDKGIYSFDGTNKPVHRANLSEWAKVEADKLKALYKPHQANHRVLVKENGSKNTRFNNPEINGSSKDIRQTFAESVLFFGGKQKSKTGQVIKDSHLEKLIDKYGEDRIAKKLLIIARNTMEVIAHKYNFELIGDTTIHMDEKGQLHVHQMHTNYDKDNGSSPNFATKIGAVMQSIVAHEFKQLGFKRGVPKAIQKIAGLTPRGNIPIRAFKELMEAQNSQEGIIKDNKKIMAAQDRKIKKLKKNLAKELEKGKGLINQTKIKYHKKKVLALTSKLEVANNDKEELTQTIQTLTDELATANETIETMVELSAEKDQEVYDATRIKVAKEAKVLITAAIEKNTKEIQDGVIKPLKMDLQIEERKHQEALNTITERDEKIHLMLKDHQTTGLLLQSYVGQFGATDAYKKADLGNSNPDNNTIVTDFSKPPKR